MLEFCKYNFCSDVNAYDPASTNLNPLTSTMLSNGVIDHWNVTRDVTSTYSSDIPTAWDFLTIMDCDFKDNIGAGNIDVSVSQLQSIRVKRREKGSFDWLTLFEIPINSAEDMKFSVNDTFNVNGKTYEYALVPVMGGAEGNYVFSEIVSKFDGVFICDQETIYRFYANVGYNTINTQQLTGIFEPLGSKYPIVVANALTNYQTGTFQGSLLPNEFYTNGIIDRANIVKYRNTILDFLTNKRAKILKDWNGNCWLMIVTDAIASDYADDYGMGLVDVSFNWTEQSSPNNQKDLYNSGIIGVDA